MKKLLFLILLTTFCFANQSKEVLLLHSYHKGYKWSDDISKAIETTFKSHENIELTTLYMDTKRVVGPIYFDKLAELYKEQFSQRNFDLIIASDNNAFDFAMRYHETLFKDLPVLFAGINNFDRKLIDQNNMKQYMSGVVEQVDIEKNFELILKLHPKLNKLVILNDTSKTGYAVKRDLQPVIEKYQERIQIEYIDNMDIETLQKRVKKLENDSAILFVLLFKDTTGKYFTYKQSFQKIKSVSSVPIYGLWDFYLDYGMVGGLLTSATAQGESVANMALQVLNGKDITEIPILEKSPNRYIFDYNEIDAFNIDLDAVLNHYLLINEPTSIYREHTKFVVLSLAAIFILSIMVITMRANIQRRKQVEMDLSNQLKFDKVLLNTLPNPIYYKNIDGRFLGCNSAFMDLLQLSRSEIIGKTAHDFYPKDIADRNVAVDKELLETLGTNTTEMTFNIHNTMKYFILNKAVYENIDGNVGGIVCIMDDITERVQQKQFLIQQSKLAEMGDMVAAIAHQWNEPLVELSAQVQDIQTSFMLKELKDSQVKEFVSDSMIQIQYMSKTLSDFRNFLKPSTKKAPFSIKNAFESIFEIVGKQIFYSNINLHVHYDKRYDDFMAYGYENEFKQVLLNLINNAKNKIIDNHQEKKGNITIDVSQSSHHNVIKIIDDAGEIDEKIIHSIFNPYFTTKKEGTGLGLYMAKVIIEDKMQGQIYVKNDGGKVVFTIKMPLKNKV